MFINSLIKRFGFIVVACAIVAGLLILDKHRFAEIEIINDMECRRDRLTAIVYCKNRCEGWQSEKQRRKLGKVCAFMRTLPAPYSSPSTGGKYLPGNARKNLDLVKKKAREEDVSLQEICCEEDELFKVVGKKEDARLLRHNARR